MVKLFKKEGTMFNKNIFKNGFTLAEVLIAVTIVGVIAVLTIPSLLKNSQEKARMTLLKGTVANLSNAVQAEMTRHRST
jgi:prepilin-type N-terminal cleavage/methylation domain-containing protein